MSEAEPCGPAPREKKGSVFYINQVIELCPAETTQ